MSSPDRFKQTIVVLLAKRAANICSNPDCRAIASGPSDDPSKAVSVGEAAHIYGAHLGSARFDQAMSSADRAAITNAIWLCGNCHKLVDDDQVKYPAGLLFEWQRVHKSYVQGRVGKAGAAARERYERRHLEEFGKLSYLAERLIVEKDGTWEYHLTAETLRFEMAPVLRRWNALQRGLYVLPTQHVSARDFGHWLGDRMKESEKLAFAFGQLSTHEFKQAWGEPGIAGDDVHIVDTCRLFAEMCSRALAWEETVRFVSVETLFDPVVKLLQGVVGAFIDEAARLPKFLVDTFSGESPSGNHTLNFVLTLPDGWSEQVRDALETATAGLITRIKSGDIDY